MQLIRLFRLTDHDLFWTSAIIKLHLLCMPLIQMAELHACLWGSRNAVML